MIDKFELWFEANKAKLKEAGITFDVARREDPTKAVNVIIESESYIGSLTIWQTGSFDVDILQRSTEEPFLVNRYDFNCSEQVVEMLDEIRDKLVFLEK